MAESARSERSGRSSVCSSRRSEGGSNRLPPPGQTAPVPPPGYTPGRAEMAGIPSARRSQSLPRFLEVGNFTVTGVPGYTGYIPGKVVENVLGTTFQRSNELAMNACESRAYPAKVMGGRRANPFGLGDRVGGDIVGYTGYIPGKYADNVFGNVFARSNHISQLLKQEQMREKYQRNLLLTTPGGGAHPTEHMTR